MEGKGNTERQKKIWNGICASDPSLCFRMFGLKKSEKLSPLPPSLSCSLAGMLFVHCVYFCLCICVCVGWCGCPPSALRWFLFWCWTFFRISDFAYDWWHKLSATLCFRDNESVADDLKRLKVACGPQQHVLSMHLLYFIVMSVIYVCFVINGSGQKHFLISHRTFY